MNVYLDTNVWIQGSKRRECETLKNLALEGTIKLYLSPTAQHEQSAQSSRLDKREQELLGQPDGGHNWEALRAVGREKERTERSEKAEREWWRPVVLEYPGSTFEGLLTIAMSGIVDPALDVRGELPLLTELLETHNIPQTGRHARDVSAFSRDGLLPDMGSEVRHPSPAGTMVTLHC